MQELKKDLGDGWTKFSDKETQKIYYKQEAGLNQLTLYLEQVIEAPLINLFAILGEVQLFKNWVPMTKQSDIISEISHLRKLAYFKNNLPWPFHQREIFLQASGIIIKEENAAVLVMSSVDSDTWLGYPIARTKGNVTIDVNKAFVYARMLDENRCVMKMIVNADPHIDYIPQRLINWCLKHVIGVFLKYIAKKAVKLPDEYQKLIEEKKEYYDELVRRISMLDE